MKISEQEKRTVSCPRCGAREGKPCKGSRIPSPSTFGGGWGGPPDLERAHAERRTDYLENRSPKARYVGYVTKEGRSVIDKPIPRKCPMCRACAVVSLPKAILAEQPDDTTHVCHPMIGGCNHGFSEEIALVEVAYR